jgi:alpha/beta superfamily hydrolase
MQKGFLFLMSVLLVATFNYAQEQQAFTISINGGTIDAAVLPDKDNNKLAIIIAGSGPTDKNGNSKLGVTANSYQLLAQALQKENIATLRYDKRGIGNSKLYDASESKQKFEDFITDAVTIYNYAKDSLGYKTIYFIGHSEGSLVAMIAAQKTKAAGYISISGAGRSIDEVVMEQVAAQPENVQEQIKDIFNQLKQGNEVDNVPQYLFSLFRPSVQPYMISWLKYKPTEEIKKLECAILIINGTCDVQVKEKEAQLLYAANDKAKLLIIPKMTHALKDTNEDCADESMKTYKDASLPINKQLAESIVQFINR